MRPTVIASARSCLIGILAASLLSLPVMGAGTPPVGMIVATDSALLSNATATRGVDVYPGDTLTTQPDGFLRIAAGSSQMFVMGSTQATMSLDGHAVRAKMDRGTIQFSGLPGQLELETPVGVVRGGANDKAYGQVNILSPTKVEISAYQGQLQVAGIDGETKNIGAGETYIASLDPSGGATDPGILGVGRPRRINWRRVAAAAIIVGGASLAAYFLYDETTESCSQINCGAK